MSARRNARDCASLTRPCITHAALLLLIGLGASSGVLAANECKVRYAYATSATTSSTVTKDINEGQSYDVPSSQGSKVLYVQNLLNHTIRVYRTGMGQYVDLSNNGRDPGLGNYIGGVTLQKVSCLSGSASSAQPPNIQQLVTAAFQAVTQATVPYLNQLNQWKSTVQGWAQKTASDWGSCPSSGAQDAYNHAKLMRSQLDSAIATGERIKADADAALANCQATTNNHPLCLSTYNGLSVHGWITSLTTTRAAINAGMTTMAALQCPQGCSQTAQLPVPVPSIRSGGTFSIRTPGQINFPVCQNLDLGSIGFNPTAVSNGNLAQIVQAQPPRCTSQTQFAVCTDWDLEGLLAILRSTNVVPPGVGRIELDIPTRKIAVVTGASPASCTKPLQVCAPAGNASVSIGEGKNLFDGAMSCASHVTVGCQEPPFGLQPTVQQIDVPDLTRATVRWSGARPGSIQIDLTAARFANLCRGIGRTLSLPNPPLISMGSRNVPLPFLCTRLNLVRVISNP